jgi:hypothetical protein
MHAGVDLESAKYVRLSVGNLAIKFEETPVPFSLLCCCAGSQW